MKRIPLIILALLLLPLAAGAYSQTWVRPSCTSGHGVIGGDLTVGAQKTLSNVLSGNTVPLIEMEWSADAIANAPMVIAITDGLMPTTGNNQTSEGYWAGGAISAYVKTWVAFKAYKNVSGAFTPTTIYTVNFTTQTLSTSNADLGFSDVSWHNANGVMPSGQLYLLVDQSNRTGSAANFGATIGKTTCTGGSPNSVIRFGGGIGDISADWDLSMAYYTGPPSTQNPPLFGRDGQITGNLSSLSQALFGTPHAYDATLFWVGFLLLIGIAGGIASVTGMWGGIMGGFVGVLFLGFINWWPVWLVVLTLVGIGGISFLLAGKGGEA